MRWIFTGVGWLAAWTAMALPACAASVEFRAAETDARPGLTPMTPAQGGVAVYVDADVLLSNADIAAAKVGIDRTTKGYVVRILFTPEGGQKLAVVTKEHVGHLLAIVIDGQLLSAPKIEEPITSNEADIEGRFTRADAIRVAEQIMPEKSATPAP